MKKLFSLVFVALIYLGAEAKVSNQSETNASYKFIMGQLKEHNKESDCLYPIVTLNLSCGSFTTLPTSPLGGVIVDMAACCPASLALLLQDFDCWLCNNGCPLPPEAYYA